MAIENTNVRVGFGVMLVKDGKVLLGKRHDDPEKADSELHGEGTWTMPGGKLQFHESFEDGCSREVMEETGITIDQSAIKLVSIANNMVADAHFITLGFICREFTGEPKVMEPDEITEWQWFSPKDLPARVFPPSREILDHYFSGLIYSKIK